MGQTKTNDFSMAYAFEASPGVLGGSPIWKTIEPNGIPSFGDTISKVARNPISKNRQRRKGVTTDQDSAVEVEHDLTMDPFIDFARAFVGAAFVGRAEWDVTATITTAFTVLTSGYTPVVNDLVFARGFPDAVNNGLHVVNGVPTTTSVTVVTTLTADASPPTNAVLEVAGRRGAVGDLEIDANGDLISTLLDFTTLALTPGQAIWIGGEATANQFAEQVTSDTNYGFARVVSVATNLITLDKRRSVFTLDDGATKLVDIYFGRFLRNVPVDDGDYEELTLHFEGAFVNLEPGPATGYEYSIQNWASEMTIDIPLTEKATATFNFIGSTTEEIVTTQKTGADTPIQPVRTGAFGTSSDVARLRLQQVDETGLTTCFKSLSITISNNVEPEKCIGVLGASFINRGNFDINLEAQLLFTNSAVTKAIKDNETVGLDLALDNGDGGIFIDIPAMTMGGGDREFPVNQSILINTSGEAFGDPVLNTSIGITLFPFVPQV